MLLDTGIPNETTFEGPIPTTYYISTDGSYIGKEFIFIASQGLSGTRYRILALEDSKVTVYKEDGGTYMSFGLKANEYKDQLYPHLKDTKLFQLGIS